LFQHFTISTLSTFFIAHGFNRGRRRIQKNHTGYKPEISNTDFLFFLKIVHRHRLQTGAKHQHRQTKIPNLLNLLNALDLLNLTNLTNLTNLQNLQNLTNLSNPSNLLYLYLLLICIKKGKLCKVVGTF
jgi:hypothetical protein